MDLVPSHIILLVFRTPPSFFATLISDHDLGLPEASRPCGGMCDGKHDRNISWNTLAESYYAYTDCEQMDPL